MCTSDREQKGHPMTARTDHPETAEDFAATLQVGAPPDRVLSALRTPEAVAAWWGPTTGSAEVGGTLVVSFQEGKQQIVIHPAPAEADRVVWQVERAPLTPEWAGTTIVFQVSASGNGSVLHFRHHGLTPQLECFDMCFAGWTHYAASLVAYAETGEGRPERHGRGAARADTEE